MFGVVVIVFVKLSMQKHLYWPLPYLSEDVTDFKLNTEVILTSASHSQTRV